MTAAQTDAEGIGSLVDIDRVIHEPARLIIVAILSTVDCADFLFLQRETGLTPGNLSSHLSRLEAVGYVEIQKGFRGKVPHTTCRLTAAGETAFAAYRKQLRQAVLPD